MFYILKTYDDLLLYPTSGKSSSISYSLYLEDSDGVDKLFYSPSLFILIMVPAAFTINPLGFLSIYSYLIFSVLSDALIGAVFSSRALLSYPILLGRLFSLIYIYVTDMDEFV